MPTKAGHKDRASHDLIALRTAYADLANAALTAAGHPPRYDPGSYKGLCIDREPQQHLGKAASALAKAGVSVDIDRSNARKYWDARHRELAAEVEARREDNRHALEAYEVRVAAVGLGSDAGFGHALTLLHEAMAQALESLEGRSRHRLERSMAESAADRLLRHTDRLLLAIEDGTAHPRDVADAVDIRRRNVLARSHLQEIIDALEPFAEELAALEDRERDSRGEIHARQDDLDKMIAEKQAVLDRQRQEQAAEDQRRAADAEAAARQRAEQAKRTERAKQVERTKQSHADGHRERQVTPADLLRQSWKAGSMLAELFPDPLKPHEHFKTLVDIARQQPASNLRVHLSVTPGGDLHFYGLKEKDAELLQAKAFENRVVAAFLPVAENQQSGIDRLLAYVRAHGSTSLCEMPKGDQPPPKAVATLYERYRAHPLFLEKSKQAQADHRANHASARRGGDRPSAGESYMRDMAGLDDDYVPPSFTIRLPTNMSVSVQETETDRPQGAKAVNRSPSGLASDDSPPLPTIGQVAATPKTSPATASPIPPAEPVVVSATPLIAPPSVGEKARAPLARTIPPQPSDLKEKETTHEHVHRPLTIRDAERAVSEATASFEPDDRQPRHIGETRSIASLRRLSSFPLLSDLRASSVLLHDVQKYNIGPNRAADASDQDLRRESARDRGVERDRAEITPAGVAVPIDPLVHDTSDVSEVEVSASEDRVEADPAASPAGVAPSPRAQPPFEKHEAAATTSATTATEAVRDQARALQRARAASAKPEGARKTEQSLQPLGQAGEAHSLTSEATDKPVAVDRILEELGPRAFLPLRRVRATGEGLSREVEYQLIPEEATTDDQDLIGRAAGMQQDGRIQARLASAWQAMLAQLRVRLTTERTAPVPKPTGLGEITDDPRLQAAIRAAGADLAVRNVFRGADTFWAERSTAEAASQDHGSVSSTAEPDSKPPDDHPVEEDGLSLEQLMHALKSSKSRS